MSDIPVHTIRIPNPFVEGRNCVYVLAGDPVTIIDSGIATDRAFDELVAGLAQNGLKPEDIRRVVLTHKHIDHIGNAWRISQLSGAEIMIHRFELSSITDVDPTGERYAELVSERLGEWSVPAEAKPSREETSLPDWKIESADASPLEDGQRLPMGDGHIEVIHTPGHTAGSVCLRFGRYVFSGDHVLPEISPNIGGGDLRHNNLLDDYLQSLRRIREVFAESDIQMMPGHGRPMISPTQRCDELLKHHQERLDDIVRIVRGHSPQTVFEIACRLFGEMKSFHVILGCAEAHAHLELLVQQDRITASKGRYE